MTETEKTEKITINLSVVDLGQIDLLVQEGFYSNRTDFFRAAVRELLTVQREVIKQTITRRSMAVGVIGYSRRELEEVKKKGEKLAIKAVGMAVFAKDITPQLALDTIESLEVYGVLRISDEIRQALGERIK